MPLLDHTYGVRAEKYPLVSPSDRRRLWFLLYFSCPINLHIRKASSRDGGDNRVHPRAHERLYLGGNLVGIRGRITITDTLQRDNDVHRIQYLHL